MEIILISIVLVILVALIFYSKKDAFYNETTTSPSTTGNPKTTTDKVEATKLESDKKTSENDEDPKEQEKERLRKERDVVELSIHALHDTSFSIFKTNDVFFDFTKDKKLIYSDLIDICGTEEKVGSLFAEMAKHITNALNSQNIDYDGVYLEKFLYSKDKYTITFFIILDHETNKYVIELNKNGDNISFEKLTRKNSVVPINRFLCNEGNDCTSRHTSLKPVGIKQHKVKGVSDETELDKTFFKGGQSPILLLNRNRDIAVKFPKNIKPFPCRRNIHIWNNTSALYTQNPTKKCKGIDSSYQKRNIIPRPHPSFFANPGFWAR